MNVAASEVKILPICRVNKIIFLKQSGRLVVIDVMHIPCTVHSFILVGRPAIV